jgi:hypothetical protein
LILIYWLGYIILPTIKSGHPHPHRSYLLPLPLVILGGWLLLHLTKYLQLRAAFPTIEIECYIQKPVEIKDLVRRINAELDQ